MRRDSLFGERIIWTGRAKVVKSPETAKGVAGLLFTMSAIATSYAFVLGLSLHMTPTATLVLAFWCASLGLACLELPKFWLLKVRYIVTENHVIWQRGPFRRSIERRSISFARIFWYKDYPNSGDIELVRAVPTGAMRRRLRLRLSGVHAPDRVWAIIRGAEDVAPTGRGERPLSQRLDRGERVIWSAESRLAWRAYLPHGRREWTLWAMVAVLLLAVVRTALLGVPAVGRVVEGGVSPWSLAFLVFGLTATAALLLVVAGYLAYDASIRPGKAQRHTRYLITPKRVLIQRGREELHVSRSKIVEAIHAPAREGLSDLFLVLDGPRARALATSGAFGELERGPHLMPVFECVDDAEGARRILAEGSEPDLPRAA